MEPVSITVDRDDLDNAVFSAAQEVADRMVGLTARAKVKFALETADTIMASVDSITEAGKRSASAKKAAEARYSKPKPGPAIPAAAPAAAPFQATKDSLAAQQQAAAPAAPVPGNFLQAPDTIPPPPHPALAPGQTPFGAPPA
jgi:hypothetical protein